MPEFAGEGGRRDGQDRALGMGQAVAGHPWKGHRVGVRQADLGEPGPVVRPRSYGRAASWAAPAARRRYAGVMIRPSGDGRRLTAHLEPGGPCIAVAEHQPDGRWLVNGRAMSREHAGIALEAAVTVAAASRDPHGAAQVPAGVRRTEADAESSAVTAETIP
jgi:hypothetical protein